MQRNRRQADWWLFAGGQQHVISRSLGSGMISLAI